MSATDPPPKPGYLLLMRHGEHRDHVLTVVGHRDVAEVAKALAERLEDPPERMRGLTLSRIYHAASGEATATAEKVAAAFGGPPGSPRGHPALLESSSADALDRESAHRAVLAVWRAVFDAHDFGDDEAILLVGHLPLLAWVAAEVTGAALPMGRGELLAIRLDRVTSFLGGPRVEHVVSGEFRWALTPERRGKEIIALVRDKIRSKMEAAKYLASFVTATLGIQLALLVDPAKLTPLRRVVSSGEVPDLATALRDSLATGRRVDTVAVARTLRKTTNELAGADQYAATGLAIAVLLLVVAAGLFFVTVFAYDKLLMPPELWADGRPRAATGRRNVAVRPPSGAGWVLFQEMQRVWRLLFTPAVVLLLAGLLLQAGVLLGPTLDWSGGAVWLGLAVVMIIPAIAWTRGWPRLGSED